MADAEIAVQRIDDLGLDPLTAFARLRSYTPGRGAFLLESLRPDATVGRYSIVGYRVRSCELMPPGIDAITVQFEAAQSKPAADSFAVALAQASVGFFSSSVASLWQRIRLYDDEGPTGTFAIGATVVVFDHHEHTISVAGPAKGKLVDRCIWELRHGPDPAPLLSTDGALPEPLHPDVTDEKLQARAARARGFVAELEFLTLARTFTSPIAAADGFDCYRALREGDHAHGYYLDFGDSPMQARLQVTGVARTALHLGRPGDPRDGREVLRASLPHRATVGAPAIEALRLIRQFEDSSRQTWGGAVGYLAPGGVSALVLADEVVALQHGAFWCTAGTSLDHSSDPLGAADATRAAAHKRLLAIAVAQRTAAIKS